MSATTAVPPAIEIESILHVNGSPFFDGGSSLSDEVVQRLHVLHEQLGPHVAAHDREVVEGQAERLQVRVAQTDVVVVDHLANRRIVARRRGASAGAASGLVVLVM